jgi:DNA-binding NarL/FixJ family response regulator
MIGVLKGYTLRGICMGTSHVTTSTRQPSSSQARSGPDHDLTVESDVVNVSIVSNSRLLCDGLAALLARYLESQIVGKYSGYPPADPGVSLPNPEAHVVLLDASMGQDIAVTWTHYWGSILPPPPVIVFDLVNNLEVILTCIEAGARGYTLQGASVTDVVEVVWRARHGEACCSPQIVAGLFARLAAYSAAQGRVLAPSRTTVPLTQRELEVLQCIADNYSNQEIAEKLVIQLHTVKHHVHNILDKLKLRNRWEAARLANERGWLDEDSY